ncbi:putative spindle-pole body protein (Pcp1) [Fonsecaea pedrosoi]|nr:putative spindle-pole body protein (Pcp1) [Fonsecaea pedrosoi]
MANYINTPQATDASYITNGLDRLGEISPEKSFAAPPENRDLISQMRNAKSQGLNLRTPRAGLRDPLRLLPNGNQGRSEFTPLMQSAAKKNIARRLSSKKPGVQATPSYLKGGYTPGAPRLSDISQFASEHTSSSAGNAMDSTPMPQQISSSAQSTPLVPLPGRDAAGLVNDGNMMTLREQESIIDKVEKENFGLKMKIHFLEEALSKRGNEFNQAALKENTDLKVNRITMQRELHKFKKNIAQAEKDAEVYRLQLEEFKERIRRKQVDESVRVELETLRTEVKAKDKQIKALETERDSAKDQGKSTVEKLKDEIEDLQAELREKDRKIDERDDQIDALKAKASKESNDVAEIEDELESARQEIEDLKQDLERAKAAASEAKEVQEEALEGKRKAEEDLEELRDEMANKSFTTKGLSRQLEEKTNKLEDDLDDLQERHNALQVELAEKTDSERQLREKVRELEREGGSELRKLQQDLEQSQQQRDTFERKLNSMAKQLETVEKDLQVKVEEKDLLQTRHDALTKESAELQKDLSKAQKSIRDLELALDEERQHSAQNENLLRSQHKQEVDLLNEQIDGLHREVHSKERDHAADLEEWEAQKRTLEAASQKAEEKANGLQRTVDKFQDAQGTINGREMKLQAALESEKQRHHQEEKVLLKQIEELQQDLANKRTASDENRLELNNAKEELRISIRDQAALREKVAELEEEIEVLQADIEQEHDFAEKQQQKFSSHADAQIQQMQEERQSLQKELVKRNSDLQDARMALKKAEEERDALESKLQNASKSNDETFGMDQEKRELKRLKVKLEKDIARLTTERDNLHEANQALEDEINAELERAGNEEARLSAEIDSLRNQKAFNADNRDRELTSAKNKVARLETRIKELEEMLDNPSKTVASQAGDLSGLRHDLVEARNNETAATKREADLKANNRDLKMQVNNLERELHEAKLAQYKAKSPSVSPPPSHSKEVARLRQELVDIRAEVQVLNSENRELKRATRRASTDEDQLVMLQTQIKSRTAEVESLSAKIAEQNDLVNELQEELNDLREKDGEAQHLSSSIRKRDRQIHDLKAQLKRLRDEQEGTNDLSMRLSSRDNEAREMKHQLRRLREERSVANQKAEAVENELEALQTKYEGILERLTSGKSSRDEVRAKEMKGLIKEIMWLKAKCRREERLRKDLAWSKAFLEQGEAVRVECNQVDLHILGEMGVSLDKRKYEVKLKPVQKLRAGVFAVIAAIRMSNMEEQWRDAKLLGEELKLIRTKQSRQRSIRRVLEV